MSLSRSEISLLTAGPLFRGVSEELLQALAGAEGASLVRFEPGLVYSPRHFRRSLAVVLSGQLQVTKGALAVSVLGPGDLFGAAALYSDEPEFAATVTAKRPSRCLMLEQRLVDRLLAEQSALPHRTGPVSVRAAANSGPAGGGGQAGPLPAGQWGQFLPRHRAVPAAGGEPGLPLPGLLRPGGQRAHHPPGQDHHHC